jgi:hypothetical protein
LGEWISQSNLASISKPEMWDAMRNPFRVNYINDCMFIEDLVRWRQWRSTNHTHKTKDRETRIPLKIGGELTCSGMKSNSCSTSGTRHVNLVTNPMLNHEWGKDREVFTTSGTYPWSTICIQIWHLATSACCP